MKDVESIYRQFVQFEERAAAIYLQLASRFSRDPQLSSLWFDMAMQEKQHAGLLQFCIYEQLFAQSLPDTSEIQRFNGLFEGLEKSAADPNLTLAEAFSLAIEMEASEINTVYCCLTDSLHVSTYLLRRKIATTLPDHIAELITAARKFGVSEDVLQKINQAQERCSKHWRPPA
jgi:hypothetical protein